MMRFISRLLLFSAGILIPTVVTADYLVVSRGTAVRSAPERTSAALEAVKADDLLRLINDGTQRNGYYHVWVPSRGRDGWIYRGRVRRKLGLMPVTADSRAQNVFTYHCQRGCPVGASPDNELIVREIYTLSNNGFTKFADWVAYKVEAGNLEGTAPARYWRKDPVLDVDRTMEPVDYDNAHELLGIDRGHQAPLASFQGTNHAAKTNYLSNITPQKSDLNQGPWKMLEADVRHLSARHTVYVMTGPVYEREMPLLPSSAKEHRLPSGYWKIVSVEAQDQPGDLRVAAFFFDQKTQSSAHYSDHVTTIDVIEAKTGLDFFANLPDPIEQTIESARNESWVRSEFVPR